MFINFYHHMHLRSNVDLLLMNINFFQPKYLRQLNFEVNFIR